MGWMLIVAAIDAYAALYSAQHHYAPLLVVWLLCMAALAAVGFLGMWLIKLSKAMR